jgi:L-2,4-diaminobutyrate transaminase
MVGSPVHLIDWPEPMVEHAAPSSTVREADRRTHLHPFTSAADHAETLPRLMVAGEGIRVRDSDGQEYVDAMAGLWCVNVGYGRREIADAAEAQARRLPYYHTFASMANEPAARLADRLVALAPGDMSKVFFGSSGSETNDTQVKIVRYYHNVLGKPDKKKIIAREGAYHGSTLAGASMSGMPHMHTGFDLPLDGFVHVKSPHYWRHAPEGTSEQDFSVSLAEDLEACILREGPDTVAAFIAEPVQGAAGVVTPPAGYFEAIVPVLRKYDVLFIADEVICGFGRLGRWWGSDHYGLEPDLVSTAKGLTSGYVPMSACLISERVWTVLREGSSQYGPFAHGYTYSGHPVAAAAALANLDVIEGEGLVENAARVGAHLQARLREAFGEHPLVGELRGVGLIAGIELVEDKESKRPFDLSRGVARRLHELLMEEGLICRPVFNTLAFSPPLIVSRDDVDRIVAAFARGLDRLTEELRARRV